jgi:hypothetical protein
VNLSAQTRGKRRYESSIEIVTASDEFIRPYRHLALGVVERALLDLSNPGASAADRESAQAFLRGSSMLFHWCEVAALDPWCIVNHAEKLRAGLSRLDGHCSSGDAIH